MYTMSAIFHTVSKNSAQCRSHYYLCACCEQVLFLAASLCESVRLSVRTKSQKLLIINRCNLVGMCPMVNARSASKLVTFDLDL